MIKYLQWIPQRQRSTDIFLPEMGSTKSKYELVRNQYRRLFQEILRDFHSPPR